MFHGLEGQQFDVRASLLQQSKGCYGAGKQVMRIFPNPVLVVAMALMAQLSRQVQSHSNQLFSRLFIKLLGGYA